MWQDWIITIGQALFIVALVPAVLAKEKPPLLTSLLSAAVLFVFGIVYITLSFWFAALSTTGTGVLWAILAFQKWKSK